MLGSHSEVFTHPEPHLITPLAHLGFYANVQKAPFDHINAAEALELFVSGLPGGEADYLEALRRYADHMYGRMLETSSRSRFLDKTPAYALVLPFLMRLYPEAKYVVLTRHPLAVFSSYANSFFEGNWETARSYNPIVERYVPAMGAALRDPPVPICQVGYEELVSEPEQQLERIFGYLGLENQPEAVNYGERFASKASGPGDPITVQKQGRPVTASVHKWANEVADDPAKLALAEDMIRSVDDADLEAWGYPRESIFAPLEATGGRPPKKRPSNSYTFQRRVMLALRKDIHRRPHGAWVKRIRYFCDVLLRDWPLGGDEGGPLQLPKERDPGESV
jgi:hypothetical protein